MKKLLICSVVTLAVLAAVYSTASSAEEKSTGQKKMVKAHRYTHDANAMAVQDANAVKKQAKRAEPWMEALQARIGRLEAIREIAVKEGATKTVEALDKFIADEKKQHDLRQQRIDQIRAKHKAGLEAAQKKDK
jgi:hypothetical protein